jgi:DNA polymerase (family X)
MMVALFLYNVVMNKPEIIKILEDIAALLELKSENVFKSRAYQKAARSIEFLSEDLDKLVREDRLREIPGVGEAIAKKLSELITTGRMEYYEKLKSEFPAGIGAFLEVPGIGPRTALLLTRDLGIQTLEELEKAIEDGRVAALPRMGEKTARNILQQIQAFRKKKSEKRVPLGVVLPIADSIINSLKNFPGLHNLTIAGSLRRFRDTIGDIDILGTADNPAEVIQSFTMLPQVREVLEKGPTKASVLVEEGIQVDIRLLDHDSFGSALQYFTGSKQHNLDLRKRAERLGLSLSEYGILNTKNNLLEKFADEEAFYARQGLKYIPPELREGLYEIEMAEKNTLPRLLELSDIKGDLHIHTDWSDGVNSLEDMARAALSKGYKYMAVTDHSAGLGIARGLDSEKVKKQIEQIRQLNQKFTGFRVLTGLEVDIRANGALDMPDDLLADLDIVLASIHSAMNQGPEQMTDRIIKAIENPNVDVIAHPTGRLLGEREPVALYIENILQAALEHHTAMEISAMPARLDLKDTHIHMARQMGVKMIINTDSHRIEQMDSMHYGVGTARRGWCEAGDILNTISADQILERFKGGKKK